MADLSHVSFDPNDGGMNVHQTNPSSGGSGSTNDGSYAKETGGHLAAIDTSLAASKTDLDTIVSQTTGLATATNQTTGNTSLSTIATNTTNVANVEGATTDTAVTSDINGTNAGKLRGLVKILADIWDSVNHRIKVDGSGVTQPVSAASLPLPSGASTSAKQPALGTAGTPSADVISVQGVASGTAQPISASSLPLPTGAATSANQTTGNTSLANIDTHTPALGQATMANSSPVTLASDQTPKTSATATRTNVTAAASDTSLLASNTSRKGALFFNDSTATLYLSYGSSAASTTSYSTQVPANNLFELPPEPIYTGAIRGIWASANGAVRITELT